MCPLIWENATKSNLIINTRVIKNRNILKEHHLQNICWKFVKQFKMERINNKGIIRKLIRKKSSTLTRTVAYLIANLEKCSDKLIIHFSFKFNLRIYKSKFFLRSEATFGPLVPHKISVKSSFPSYSVSMSFFEKVSVSTS